MAPAVVHRAVVGNGQLVARAGVADVDVVAVAPDRAAAGDGDGVAAGGGVVADVAGAVVHRAAAGDRQRVARAVVADFEVAIVAPDGAAAGDGDGVVIGTGDSAEVTGAVEHFAAAGNRQRVARAGLADADTAVSPDGAAAGHQRPVVAVTRVVAEVDKVRHQDARVGDDQTITGKTLADVIVRRRIGGEIRDGIIDVGLQAARVLRLRAARARQPHRHEHARQPA